MSEPPDDPRATDFHAMADAANAVVSSIMDHSDPLSEKERFALLMTVILALTDKLLRIHPDPDFTYLTLLHSLVDIYRENTNQPPPDRNLQ